MRSPVSRMRLEQSARVIALVVLSWLVVATFRVRAPGSRIALDGPPTAAQLGDWTATPPGDTLGMSFTSAPGARTRDWLRALRRAGTALGWSDAGVPALLIEGERRPDPAETMLLRVSGPAGATVRLSDALGALDSFALGAMGASRRLPELSGALQVSVRSAAGEQRASVIPAASEHRRHLVVLGAAGWEAKFIAAALAERGWVVDARYALAPGLAVTQGTPFPLDTARHAAVLVLDSTAAGSASAIQRYLHDGGGVLLGHDAGSQFVFQRITTGTGGVRIRPSIAGDAPVSRAQLALHDLAPLVEGAQALETRGAHVAVAARRVGAGRLLQVGYGETWHWRMQGGPDGQAAHRDWWTALVATIAYDDGAEPVAVADPAPRAALFEALGEPSVAAPHRQFDPVPLLLMLLMLSLFVEWTSRRLRGAR